MPVASEPATAIAASLVSLASSSFNRTCSAATQAQPSTRPLPPTLAPAPAAPAAVRLDLHCLNGLRVVASLAVVLFHCYLIWNEMVDYPIKAALAQDHWFVRLAMVGGPIAVDFFLVLAGMLAAYQLVPALEGSDSGSHSSGKGSASSPSCWRVTLSYWRKRALRLLPAYLATNLLLLLLTGPAKLQQESALARGLALGQCPAHIWRNLLFITNADVSRTCGLHLWSMALQVQFYLAFPLLLLALRPRSPGFRTRLAAALAAIIAGGTAWRLWQASKAHHLPLGDLHQPSELAAYLALLDASYFPTGTRVAELAVGAALGLLLRSHRVLSWLQRRRSLVAVTAMCLQAAYCHLFTHWNPHSVPGEAMWQPRTVQLYTALLYYGSPFMAALVAATLLALMLHADPLHSFMASLLGSTAFEPLSRLSYCLYLVHEPARLWGILLFLPAGSLIALTATSPVTGLAALAALTLAASYSVALALYHLVERRF